MKNVDITLIIVNWNGGEEILAFLKSIFVYTKNIFFEVIVVDNDSADNSVQKIKSIFPQTKIIQQKYNSGYARAHNSGWREANGRYIAFLNLDMELRENSFEKLVSFLDAHPGVDVVAPTLIYPNGSVQPNVKRNPTFFSQITILLKLHFLLKSFVHYYFWRDFDYEKEQEVPQLMGACIVARREMVEKIGGWGEEYFPILWEDIDFCKKVQLCQGTIVYTPITKIIHHESTSFLRFLSFAKQKRFNRGMLTYFKKYHKKYEFFIVKILHPMSLFLALGVQIARLKPRSQAKASVKEMQKINDPIHVVWMYGNTRNIFYFFLCGFGIELISFFSHQFSFLLLPAMILVAVSFSLLSWKNFPAAAALLFFELFIGSKGHFLDANIFGFSLSLRLIMFIILFFRGFFYSLFLWKREKKLPVFFFFKKNFYALYFFFFFLFLGTIFGFYHNAAREVFFDLNGYFYFAIFFIVPEIFFYGKNSLILFEAFIAGILWIFMKTFFLFFVFSHGISSIAPTLYRWVRDASLAEPTRLPDSNVYRIFLQSHIFALIGFFIFFMFLLKRPKDWKLFFLSAISLATLLISFSRSFFVAAFLVFSVFIIFEYKNFFQIVKLFIFVSAFSVSLIGMNLFFPLEKFLSGNAFVPDGAFSERFDFINEAGAKSRWSQILPIVNEIKKRPFFGHGFGKTVTYKSSDPRNLEKNRDGKYTTYAFEWGYLDIVLKIGIIGLSAYFYFLWTLLSELYKNRRNNAIISQCGIFIILTVMLTHIFTPYLNHPLGIGAILIVLGYVSYSKIIPREII